MSYLREGTILQGGAYRYRIEKVLGQGSFGITYLATAPMTMEGPLGSIQMDVRVAIKEFFMRDINGRSGSLVTSGSKGGLFDDYKKKFLREARNLSKMKNPHIVKVVESFEANGTAYFVMEFLSGGSLGDYISKKRKLDESEALPLLRDIGSALSYMHASRIFHLDMKPANVMLRVDGSAVVIDFGLSKQYDANGRAETSTSVGMGTPGYAPLEQSVYRDGKGFPVTMDVYALGATLFKMLTGSTPPDAPYVLNTDNCLRQELQEHGVSNAMIACIEKAMAPMVKDRYQSVNAFISALPKNTSSNKKAYDSEATILDAEVVEHISDKTDPGYVVDSTEDFPRQESTRFGIEIVPGTEMVRIDYMPAHGRGDRVINSYRVALQSFAFEPNYTQESTHMYYPLTRGEYEILLNGLNNVIQETVWRIHPYKNGDDFTMDFFPPKLKITLYDKDLKIYDEIWSYGSISGNMGGRVDVLEQKIRQLFPQIDEYLNSSYAEKPLPFSLPK